MPVSAESAIKRLNSDFSKAWQFRESNYDTFLKEVAEFVYPNAKRFISNDEKHDRTAMKRVLFNDGKRSLDTLASGMLSGTCSPSQKWFQLGVSSFQTSDNGFKVALKMLEDAVYLELARSNFYKVMHQLYKFEGAFGTACALIDDFNDGGDSEDDPALNLILMPFGSYALRVNHLNKVDGLYRKFKMSLDDILRTYGEDKKDYPDQINKAIADKKGGQMFTVCHVIEATPIDKLVENEQLVKKNFSSYHFLENESDKFLRISGYDFFPAITPRWEVIGNDPYGESPATLTIGDMRELQKLQILMLEGTERMVNPPILLPTSMKDQMNKLVPKGVLFFEPSMVAGSSQAQAQNAMNVQFNYDGVRNEAQYCVSRIKSAFYTDLFLMLDGFDKTNMTATEVAERKSEKMLMLGSVLERQTDEALRPVIQNIVFRILNTRELTERYPAVAEAFGAYKDEDYQIEFVSILAQAQKASGSANLERAVQFLLGVAGTSEDAMLAVNPLAMMRNYVDINSVNANVLLGEKEYKEAKEALAKQRQQQAQAQAMQQQAQSLGTTAEAVKTVSELGDNPNDLGM